MAPSIVMVPGPLNASDVQCSGRPQVFWQKAEEKYLQIPIWSPPFWLEVCSDQEGKEQSPWTCFFSVVLSPPLVSGMLWRVMERWEGSPKRSDHRQEGKCVLRRVFFPQSWPLQLQSPQDLTLRPSLPQREQWCRVSLSVLGQAKCSRHGTGTQGSHTDSRAAATPRNYRSHDRKWV